MSDDPDVAMNASTAEIYNTARWAKRRRPLDLVETTLVRKALADPDDAQSAARDRLRYALSFARLTTIKNADSYDVDVMGILGLHAKRVHDLCVPTTESSDPVSALLRLEPQLTERTLRSRSSILEHLPIDRDSLEAEVTQRVLAVVSGGGGGAGYVYPGCYEMLERAGVEPRLMVGTSIGALMSMFRARRRRYDMAPMVQAARSLAWSKVFRVLDTRSRYGLPATLRLYLRSALGNLFEVDGVPVRLSDMEIPLYSVVTGITVDALRHDLNFYEHLIEGSIRGSRRARMASSLKAMSILKEFLQRPDSLKEVVLGRTPGTKEFDTLDAAGFSSAIPGVIHYDVIRDDPRMHRLLDDLYATLGITRLGEGGMVANVASKVAWESVVAGNVGRRNAFVVALDCFAPNPRRPQWLPFMQLVRSSNVVANMKYTDSYTTFRRTLSPLNLVPSLHDALTAIRWGREAIEPEIPFISEMMRRLPVLRAP